MSVALCVNRGNASGMLKHDGPATERVELTLETVEFLRIAAVVATNVRRGSHRKVNIYKPATGETLRQAPLDEYYTGIARTLDITFSLRDDAPQTVCAGWEGPCPKKAKPPASAFKTEKVNRRQGDPWRCYCCGQRKRYAATPQELRSEVAKRRAASTTPSSRKAAAAKRIAAMTHEQKLAANAKRAAALTGRQAPESRKKAYEAMSAQQRSDLLAKAREVRHAKTPAQRKDIALKAWATRRAKAGK